MNVDKAEARKAARERRARAREADVGLSGEAAANRRLLQLLDRFRDQTLSGYMAIRSEIAPLPAMTEWSNQGRICLPVVTGASPLAFRGWFPGCEMEEGSFGAWIPRDPAPQRPDILIVPLLAFDRSGNRLGYGGGHYDRTLAALRSGPGRPLAVGLAYGGQESPEPLPTETTDVALHAIVTEAEVILGPSADNPLAPAGARP